MIQSIDSIFKDENGEIHVIATIEDMVETYSQTMYDPAEYGPALCEASFELDDDEVLPDTEYELISFLESLDLNWKIIYSDDDYIDSM